MSIISARVATVPNPPVDFNVSASCLFCVSIYFVGFSIAESKVASLQQVIVTPKQFNEVYRENKKLRQEVEILKQAMSIMTAK
ncbi:hypothetical protein bcgnr5386_42140 [Bacillus cereus]